MSRRYNSVDFLVVDMAPKKGPPKKRKPASEGMYDSFGIDPSDDTFFPEISDPDDIQPAPPKRGKINEAAENQGTTSSSKYQS